MIYGSTVDETAQEIGKSLAPTPPPSPSPTPVPEAADLPPGFGGGIGAQPATIHFNNPASAPQENFATGQQLPGLAQQRFAQNIINNGLATPAIQQDPRLQELYREAGIPLIGPYGSTPLTHQFATGINTVLNVIGAPARFLSEGINQLPAVGLPGTTLGAGGGGLTGYQGKRVGQSDPFVQGLEQTLPYVLAPELGPVGEATNTALLASGVAAPAAQTGLAAAQGQIAPGDAAKTLAIQIAPLLAPELARIGIRTLPAAMEYFRTPEGRALVQRLQSERGSIGGEPPTPPAEGEHLPVKSEQTAPDTVSSGVFQIANKFRDMIATARKLSPEQAAMITAQKAQRVAGAAGRLEQGGGLEAFHESKSLLAGEYDKPTFEPLNIPPEDVNAMVDHIGMQNADYFDKLGALTAIEKATLGVKPQPNELDKLEMFLPESRIKDAFQQQTMQGAVRGVGEKVNFPSDIGGTQVHLLESDPAYVAARQARDAATSADIRARYQAEMDRIAASQARLSTNAAQAQLVPAGGQQTHLADAINEAYVGALADSGAPEAVQSRFTRVLQSVLSPLQLAKSIKTSFDIGWGGRNGWRLLPSSPDAWFRMYGRQFKALVSQSAFDEMQAEAKAYPWFQRAQASERPLAFLETGTGNPATSGEEFMSPLTKYIPGLRGSERAYVGPGNLMRAEVMDSNIRRAVKALGRPLNDAEFQALEDNLNNATLRGNTKWLGQTNAQVLSSTLFSTKGIVSSPQFAMDFFRMLPPSNEISPAVRGIIAQRVAAYVAMGMGTLGLAAATGFGLDKAGKPGFVKVDLNPFSKSSFGMIDINGFRWNFWGQDQPLVRAAIQIGMGKQSPAEGLSPTSASRTRLAKNLVASKVAPGIPTWLWDELGNGGFDTSLQQNINTPKGVGLFAGNQFAPIVGSNPVQAYRDLGAWAVAPSLLSEVQGASTSTFRNAPTPKQKSAQDLQKANFPTGTLNDQQQAVLNNAVGVSGGTLAEARANFADKFTRYYETHDANGRTLPNAISALEAKRVAMSKFDSYSAVKATNAALTKAEHQWVHDNPYIFLQAVEAGALPNGQQPDEYEKQVIAWARAHPQVAQ